MRLLDYWIASMMPEGRRGGEFISFSCRVFSCLSSIGEPSRVAQRLSDASVLQIGVIGEDIVNALPNTDLANNRSDRDAHAPDTCLATHYPRILRDAIEPTHSPRLDRS